MPGISGDMAIVQTPRVRRKRSEMQWTVYGSGYTGCIIGGS